LTVVTFETPMYYVLHGQDNEARMIINDIYLDEYAQEAYNREAQAEKGVNFEDVVSVKYREQLLLCLFVYFTTVYIGLSSLNYYSTIIFLGTNADTGTDNETNNETPAFIFEVRILNLCIGLIRIATAILGSYLVDKYGRRALMLGGNIVVVLTLFGFSGFGLAQLGFEQRIDVLCFAAAAGVSYNLVMPIYISELLPSKGISIIVMFDNFNATFAAFLFPIILDTPQMLIWGFAVFGMVGLLSAPVLWLFFKETKNRSLNEIYQLFHPELEMGKMEKDERQGLLKGKDAEEKSKDEEGVVA